MKKSRLTLNKFSKTTMNTEMLDKISGGRAATTAQEFCHPGDPKNR